MVGEAEREASWLWHYDNNPKEVMKLLIYLNDIGPDNAPLEFCTHKDGTVPVIAATRFGPACWHKAKRNTRLTPQEVDKWVEMGCQKVLVTGKKGTLTAFIPNVIHRANPAKEGYRDALFIRVRPTIEPTSTYTNKKWSTSFEIPGVVPENPSCKS